MRGPRLKFAIVMSALVVLAGCAGVPSGNATQTETPTGLVYESYVFDHVDVGGSAIEGGITYPDGGTDPGQYYVTHVESAQSAARFNHSVLDAKASAFVRNTSFDESSIVVIQAFPAASQPDYRVESVHTSDEELTVAINDSSTGGTADITVETVLLRVHGDVPSSVTVTTEEGAVFSTESGIVTESPDPTPTTEPDIELPYASEDPTENVDTPRSLGIHNAGDEVNGYHVQVVYHDEPDCLDATPPCGEPTEEVEILDQNGKLRPGTDMTVSELATRTGAYSISASAEVPAGDGSRTTVTDSFDWTLDESSGNLTIRITDDSLSIEEVDE